MGKLVQNNTVVAASCLGSLKQTPQRGMEGVKRTEKIGQYGELEKVNHIALFPKVLDNLSVVEIASGDLAEGTVDDKKKPHSL
jgi:hypothetical protein